jgi:hypothetical protein
MKTPPVGRNMDNPVQDAVAARGDKTEGVI